MNFFLWLCKDDSDLAHWTGYGPRITDERLAMLIRDDTYEFLREYTEEGFDRDVVERAYAKINWLLIAQQVKAFNR